MEIDKDALANFKNSDFNFIDSNSNEPDYDNLNADDTYIFRNKETVIQDNMNAHDVVATINNEFGKTTNVWFFRHNYLLSKSPSGDFFYWH